MKKILSLIAAIAMVAINGNAQSIKTTADSVSYLVGVTMGNLVLQELPQDINKDTFIKAFEQTLIESNDSSAMSGHLMATLVAGVIAKAQADYGLKIDVKRIVAEMNNTLENGPISSEELEEMKATMNSIENRLKQEKLNALANSPEALANKKAGEQYIAKKLMKKVYTHTESGLLYRVIQQGSGETFNMYDHILTKYKGSLIDGTVVEFEDEGTGIYPNQVTQGCSEMLCMMKPGMKVEVIIPGDLAYGLEGNPNRGIGPNETLVFEIETLGLCEDE